MKARQWSSWRTTAHSILKAHGAHTLGNGQICFEVLELLLAMHIQIASPGLGLALLYEGHLGHVLLQVLLLQHATTLCKDYILSAIHLLELELLPHFKTCTAYV